MKKALISPIEQVYSYNNTLLGDRVAEVADQDFPVAAPFFWVDCSDDIVADKWYYVDGSIIEKPIPEPPVAPSEVYGNNGPTVI
jgi:hypothetical protein